MQKWERDPDEQFIEDDWLEAIASVCNRMKETQYKILLRSHITPLTFNKINTIFGWDIRSMFLGMIKSFGTM